MLNPEELARQTETFNEDQWYQFLDALDDVQRRRRRRESSADEPKDTSRDGVAHWAARRHLEVDRSIREIWYLPSKSPDDEIRFLDVSDYLAESDLPLESVDFGLDVADCNYRLMVVDVASDQLDRIRRGSLPLPDGWSLDAAVIWRRGS